jgi:hypothetical protein
MIGTGGGRLWIAVMNIRFPQKPGNFLASCLLVSFTRRTVLHGVSAILTAAVVSLKSINWSIFVMQTDFVLWDVRMKL